MGRLVSQSKLYSDLQFCTQLESNTYYNNIVGQVVNIDINGVYVDRDMLAEMQMSIDALIDASEKVIEERDNSVFTDCDYLSDEETYISESKELTQCVRKNFSISLKKLIEHGAVEVS